MEACLALARSLEVDLHTTESLDDGQNDKISSFTSHLLRLRAAQTQLLELEVRLAEVKERTSSAAVANVETLQASMERIAGVIASLDRICERVGTAGLVAQLQQPFTGNMVLALPAHHREVMALISGAVSEMTALQSALQSVCSVGDLPPAASSASPPLGLLLEVASYLTRCQHYGEALTHTRHRAPLHLVTPK